MHESDPTRRAGPTESSYIFVKYKIENRTEHHGLFRFQQVEFKTFKDVFMTIRPHTTSQHTRWVCADKF